MFETQQQSFQGQEILFILFKTIFVFLILKPAFFRPIWAHEGSENAPIRQILMASTFLVLDLGF